MQVRFLLWQPLFFVGILALVAGIMVIMSYKKQIPAVFTEAEIRRLEAFKRLFEMKVFTDHPSEQWRKVATTK